MKSLMLKKENQLLIVREEMLSRNYQDLLSVIEKNRQMVHDIKHHFNVLREYEEHQEYEKLGNIWRLLRARSPKEAVCRGQETGFWIFIK